jgi:hypothetical protein
VNHGIGSNEDERARSHPVAKERDQQGAQNGSEDCMHRREWRRREEGVRAYNRALAIEVFDNLGTPGDDPPATRDLDGGVVLDVANPMGAPPIRRDD